MVNAPGQYYPESEERKSTWQQKGQNSFKEVELFQLVPVKSGIHSFFIILVSDSMSMKHNGSGYGQWRITVNLSMTVWGLNYLYILNYHLIERCHCL